MPTAFDVEKVPSYIPIGGHGVIGNMRSCALVAYDGTIDWCCLPRFDSFPIFSSILDSKLGGSWKMSPSSGRSIQLYRENTNILKTTFETASGRATILDFMPYTPDPLWPNPPEVHRILRCERGRVKFDTSIVPRFIFGRRAAKITSTKNGFLIASRKRRAVLSSSLPLYIVRGVALKGEVEMTGGEEHTFVLSYGESIPRAISEYGTTYKLTATEKSWKAWVEGLVYRGRWKEAVIRSALVLRLLVYSPTGAIVAAPTTSLPEAPGGNRNWDYRFSWIRDSAFSLWALGQLGSQADAERYFVWLLSTGKLFAHRLQPVYGVDGDHHFEERELTYLDGYRHSKPVRVGNAAAHQVQLDAYGVILDALYFTLRHGGGFPEDTYHRSVKALAYIVCQDWRKPGHGVWEIRSGTHHYVYTKVWCYVALDRASRIARMTGHPQDAVGWEKTMREMKGEILAKGWSEKKKALTMSYGSDELDAANLLLPLVRFLDPKDPKMVSTVDAIIRELGQDDLVFRYRMEDGFKGEEGAFLACSFWLVSCLAKMGRLREAVDIFEKLQRRANHLGLYSEEIDPKTGEALGNFPQAYTHMGLISAACDLDRALDREGIA